MRTVLAPERAEVDEAADFAPAESVRGRGLDAMVMVSTESCALCFVPRSDPTAVVGRVLGVREGSENKDGEASSAPLVDDATEDNDEPEGVLETGGVSSSGELGAGMGLDLECRGRRADAST